jgi:rhodanese-related sulfurtransferase
MKTLPQSIGVAILVFLIAATVTGCWATRQVEELGKVSNGLPAYGVITTQQAGDVLLALQDDPGFVLLDIRTQAEVEAGHISGAVSLDFYSPTFRDDLAALDRGLIYLIYCRTGNRTGQAYVIMEELGFERVYDMGGGISQWIGAGYPVCVGLLDAEHSCTGELPQPNGIPQT